MLLSALSLSPLFADSVHRMRSVLIRAEGAAIFRAVFLERWTKFAWRSRLMLEIRSAFRRDQPLPSATLGSPSRCSAIFTSSLLVCVLHHLYSSRLLLLAPMSVVERVVDLPAHPQAVQEHRELPRHGHHRPFL